MRPNFLLTNISSLFPIFICIKKYKTQYNIQVIAQMLQTDSDVSDRWPSKHSFIMIKWHNPKSWYENLVRMALEGRS
jgi:hypothetical protein